MTGVHTEGLVLTRMVDRILVRTDEGTDHLCRVPGKGRSFGIPVPGDRVEFVPSSATSDGVISSILDRRTLFRRIVFQTMKEIAANMEQVVLLVTPNEPIVSPRLVDRMLVGAHEGGLHPVIVLNKADRFTRDLIDDYLTPWQTAGYELLIVSAKTGEGIDRLEQLLSNRISLMAGASGVGKSTILNRLIKDLSLDTAAISRTTDRGVHTTTFTRLYPLPSGGTVADSPGVREFYPVVSPSDLFRYFPEFEPYSDQCDYDDCTHREEDGCAIRKAAEEGKIHPRRYESFRILHQSLLQGPQRGRR